MTKKIFSLLIIILLSSCGYSPLYNDQKDADFKIIIKDKVGDKYINNLISIEIKKISKNNSEKTIYVSINTNYEKKIISKNKQGSASDYKIEISSKFNIEQNQTKKEIIVVDLQNVKNITNVFDQKNYENILKRNFAASAVKKLNFELLNLE